MAQELRTAFRTGEDEFSAALARNDCVIVAYCDHVSVWTITGNFVMELDY